MNIFGNKFKAAVLALAIALGVMFSTTQSKAAFYNSYYSSYIYYHNLYLSTGVARYYYVAEGFYYYYLSGYYGDYYGYNVDPLYFKSDKHLNPGYYSSFTYHDYYYNYLAYIGDYYIRL
jgi:hypothetical protein